MFLKIVEILYYVFTDYVDTTCLLFVSKRIQSILNKYGFLQLYTYNHKTCNYKSLSEVCNIHRRTLKRMSLYNFTETIPNNISLESLCVQNACSKRLNSKRLQMSTPPVSNIDLSRFQTLRTLTLDDPEPLSIASSIYVCTCNYLKELYLFCPKKLYITEIPFPVLETCMIHGCVENIFSTHLKHVACLTLYQQHFITLHVSSLELFINGFGIYYTKLPVHIKNNLQLWKNGVNNNIRDMMNYMYQPSYKHAWTKGITPIEFMNSVIHMYPFEEGYIIYKGVKKLARIRRNNIYKWGYETILFQ